MRINFMTAMLTALTSRSIYGCIKEPVERQAQAFIPHPIYSIPRALNKKGELKKPFQHNYRNDRKTKPVKKVKK